MTEINQWNLGDLLFFLDSCPLDAFVETNIYYNVSCNLASYRGYYDQLSIIPGGGCFVDEFIDVLQNADGGTFIGYKGGEYIMTAATEIWISPYGDCSGLGLVGAVHDEERVILNFEEVS